HDPFGAEGARLPQHSRTVTLEVLGVPDDPRLLADQVVQSLLAIDERFACYVFSVQREQIEGEERQRAALAATALQCLEARYPAFREHHDLAVEDRPRDAKRARRLYKLRKLRRPIIAATRQQRHAS